ncbi:MAG: tyrosine-type recombinase/integrase [Defluviitaleaceae bacterium]|nr:tyrosine-type recombinase/integrase [Defluviitaleaceae bacterium]
MNAKNTLKLRELLKTLPQFVAGYFRSLNDRTTSHTRLAYAYDLRIFFNFISEEVFDGMPIVDMKIEDIHRVDSETIEAFMEHLTYYVSAKNPNSSKQNAAVGKSRKLASVRRMFKYLYMRKYIPANPAELVAFPKTNTKVITTLEVDEIVKLLDEVDSGENLNPRQKKFHERTKVRDAAIITLLLGTGLRVSECVGLDKNDVDFKTGAIRIIRKGGDEVVLYFGNEVDAALNAYLNQREEVIPRAGHENALFLSLQNRRITDRAIQKMVKKYTSLITQLKNISPHKLRSTFGTQLYAETHDIYLVANVLGHSDVNTTRKHYAKMDETYRRSAANAVRLRD